MGLKPWHFVVLLIVILVLFGANKLPDIAKNLGQSAKVLKKEMKELTDDESTPREASSPDRPTQTNSEVRQPGTGTPDSL